MRLWRMVLVLGLVTLLAACGRETSVQLGDGAAAEFSGERSMTGDPDDTRGGMAPGEEVERMSPPDPGERTEGPGEVPAHPAWESSPDTAPNQGVAVGEPNPGDPDGCPECTISSEPTDPAATPEPRPQNPRTEPRPGTDNPHPRQWESAEVHADDVTITLTWWSGVEPCSVLDRVEVHEQADRVVITVYEGTQAGYDGACTAQAVQKHTDVKLSAPLSGRTIVDGAKG